MEMMLVLGRASTFKSLRSLRTVAASAFCGSLSHLHNLLQIDLGLFCRPEVVTTFASRSGLRISSTSELTPVSGTASENRVVEPDESAEIGGSILSCLTK